MDPVAIQRVAALQFAPKLGDVEANLSTIESMAEAAAAADAILAVAPECALTGYVIPTIEEARSIAAGVTEDVRDRLAHLAQRLQISLIVGTLQPEGPLVYNGAIIVTPNGRRWDYRKTHLPKLGVDRVASPGHEPPFVVQLPGGMRVGILICYDLRFPEAARICALEGADLIALPTNWPVGVDFHPDLFAPARANENHCYLLAANRVGVERGARFMGRSCFLDYDGRRLGEASRAEPELLFGDVDLDLARETFTSRLGGAHEWDTVMDRRPELYERLLAMANERVDRD